MTATLTALDATFLELEQLDEGALMSIGGVMVFDALPGGGVPTVEQICADLRPRLDQLPRYSQKLSATRTGGSPGRTGQMTSSSTSVSIRAGADVVLRTSATSAGER